MRDLIIAEELCKHFEGLRLKAYLCPAGVPTIAYGSTIGVKLGMIISPRQADEMLARDLQIAYKQTINLCPSLLNESDGRLNAIVDFVFNLGASRLKASTLRKRINAGDWIGAKVEIKRWTYGGGKKLPGLILRRKAEAELL
jgi:lysozyme